MKFCVIGNILGVINNTHDNILGDDSPAIR